MSEYYCIICGVPISEVADPEDPDTMCIDCLEFCVEGLDGADE